VIEEESEQLGRGHRTIIKSSNPIPNVEQSDDDEDVEPYEKEESSSSEDDESIIESSRKTSIPPEKKKSTTPLVTNQAKRYTSIPSEEMMDVEIKQTGTVDTMDIEDWQIKEKNGEKLTKIEKDLKEQYLRIGQLEKLIKAETNTKERKNLESEQKKLIKLRNGRIANKKKREALANDLDPLIKPLEEKRRAGTLTDEEDQILLSLFKKRNPRTKYGTTTRYTPNDVAIERVEKEIEKVDEDIEATKKKS